MEPRVSIVCLGVADLARATAFYRDGLGLPTDGDYKDITFFKLRGAWLSLYPRDLLAKDAQVPADGSGFAGFTIAHNVRSKEEVDRVLAEAVRAGAKLVKPAHDAFWGGYSGYFSDPDGFLWEVAWSPTFPLD
jgi:hypothetical protein